jgi:predicted metal-dependent hydrolase
LNSGSYAALPELPFVCDSLNWRLILLPPMLHDHVILHELSHRRHMDHSDRFWGQLAAWDPDWKKHDRELNKRWNVIMDLGR